MAVSLAAAWAEHDRIAALVPANMRDSLGAVFTPRALALRLAHEALARFPHAQCPRVLDPCAGLGSLLLASLEWATVQRPQWIAQWLGGSMQGWEIAAEFNQAAHRVLSIAAQALGVPLRLKLISADALMSEHREIAGAVLMHPPFRDYSGAHAQGLAPEQRARLSKLFGSFASRPSLHGALAELCGRLVSRKAGRVAMLLPIAVADQPGWAGLRRSLASLLAPEQILPAGAVPGVTEEAGLFVFTAGKGDVSGEPWQSRRDESEQVYQSSIMRHAPLPRGTFCDIGVNPGNAAALLFTERPEPGALPIRDASDVIAFGIRKPRAFLRARTPKIAGFYAKLSPPELFGQVRILIRREGARVVAAKHQPAAFFREDLIGCLGVPGLDDDYLLGVFNSEHFARLYRDSFKEGRLRAEGRITIEQLQVLPVPKQRPAGKHYERIVALSRELQKVAGRNAGMLAELDKEVRAAFGS